MDKAKEQRRMRRLAFCAIVVSLLAAQSGRADVIVSTQPVVDVAGSTNDVFDVTLSNTGAGAITVAGFEFEITVGTPDLTFTSIDISTALPYIFAGHSLFGPDISVQPPNLPGQTLEASDSYDTLNTGVIVGAGATFGLGRVHFDLSPGTPAGPIVMSFNSGLDNLLDPSSHAIAFTAVSGVVTVVPEPGMTALVGIGLLAVLRRVRRRRLRTSLAAH